MTIPSTPAPADESGPGTGPWIEVPTGHAIRLHDGQIQVRNAKGKTLATVPPAVKKTAEHERLAVLADSLARHRAEQVRAIEAWMLHGTAVPVVLVAALWEDPDARAALTGLLVQSTDEPVVGLLVNADAAGLEVADVDGTRRRLAGTHVIVAHPTLLEDADRWRLALAEHGLTQGVDQLARRVFRSGQTDWLSSTETAPEAPYVLVYTDGATMFRDYARLMAALLPLGAELSRGRLQVRVREAGMEVLARLTVDAESPEHPSYVDHLAWFAGDDGRRLTFEEIGPVAWSEGARLAWHVHEAGSRLT